MIADGKKIALEIQAELKKEFSFLPFRPRVVVLSIGDGLVTQKFVSAKQKFGEVVGVDVVQEKFPADETVEAFARRISELNADVMVQGIVIQLPLPVSMDADFAISTLHPAKDIDALRSSLGDSIRVLPPVAGAVAEIIRRSGYDVRGKKAVVVGYGRLVGKPVAQWLLDQGASIHVIDVDSKDGGQYLSGADIIVSGAGSPGLIRPEMVKEGVALIDAGTSESLGKLRGDIDPACAEKAVLFTPVPGGVGPVTIAMLFKNLLFLIARQAE